MEYYVSQFFGDDLLGHARVKVDYVIHTAAFFYFPTKKHVDHFVRVFVKSIRFLKDEDWEDEAAIERDYLLVRDLFNFGGEFRMIPCECIKLKDDETHEDGATFVRYASITALARFLGCSERNIRSHLMRCGQYRGVVRRGDKRFFIRHIGSDEDYPRLDARIKYQTIVLQRVQLAFENGKGKLTKVGEMHIFPYLRKASNFLEMEERGDYRISYAKSKLKERLYAKNGRTIQDTIPAKYPKWVIGRSVEEVEYNIEDIEFTLSTNKKPIRVKYTSV